MWSFPLLARAPQTHSLQTSLENPSFFKAHNERVVRAPAGATVLAFGEHQPVQAFRYGDSVWGVQFHPEMTDGIVMSVIDEQDFNETEKEGLKYEAQNPHDGLRLLYNFSRICAEQSSKRNQAAI
jgi:GMP synthase (glutamine-hydrolysing)